MEPVYQHLRNISKKFRKDISSRTGDIPLSNFGKEVSKLTDWETYKTLLSIWKWCRNISGMSPKNFIQISNPEQEKSLYLSNISKEVIQPTDWQTFKKFRIIRKWYNKIIGMSPKNFRKIAYSGPEISLYFSNIGKEVSQLTD